MKVLRRTSTTVSASRSLAAARPSPRWRHRLIASCTMRRRIDIRLNEREEKGEQISQNTRQQTIVTPDDLAPGTICRRRLPLDDPTIYLTDGVESLQ